MNVIQIQDLINKIGEFNINMDLQDYFDNGEEILETELVKIDELKNELDQKLLIQLKEKADVELLQSFSDDINKKEIVLNEIYHKYRIKLSESKDSNSIPLVCRLIDLKLDYLSNFKKDLKSKIDYFNYRISTDFDSSSNTSSPSNPNQEYGTAGRATFNLSKKESLMLLYILEEVNLLKFESNAQRKNFIEQNFNFTEVRNNQFYGKSFPMTGIQSEYSKFNSNDRDELKSNNKTSENLSEKLITIMEEFKFEKKVK